MMVRILLVDDHQVMREGLRSLLQSEPRFEVVGDAADGNKAVELVKKLSPDVVVMDIGMPDLNGVEATRLIKAHDPHVKVIALSTHADKRYVFHMLDAGASGYVLKIGTSEDLVRAVTAVYAGKTFLCPEVADLVVDRIRNPQAIPETSAYSVLGARERQVIQLVAEGKTSAEVALAMHISIKTVEAHRRNISAKLGLRGIAELTKYAVREGLTSVDTGKV